MTMTEALQIAKPSGPGGTGMADEERSSTRIRMVAWGLGLALGLLQAWANRHNMQPDGVSYLDLADAYLRGDVPNMLNGYWSPLYPLLLASALRIVRPSAYMEYTLVHVVNLVVYVFAFACFDYLLKQAIAAGRGGVAAGRSPRTVVSRPVWLAFGYTLFVWSALMRTELRMATPDLLVAAFVYLAAGLLLRIRSRGGGALVYALLGVVLGLGYLAKAAMFPLAVPFLAVAAARAGRGRAGLLRITTSVLGFGLVAAPLVVALSSARGRFTFGDSGKLNYAWFVDGVTRFHHWQGEGAGQARPPHPTRKVLESPAVFEFASPVGGTYPPWYDASYWYEGVRTPFRLKAQLTRIVIFLKFYYDTLAIFIFAAILVALLVRDRRLAAEPPASWLILLPSIAGIGMYTLVLAESRYIIPFVVLAALVVLLNVHPRSSTARSAVSAVMLAFALMLGARVAAGAAADAVTVARGVRLGSRAHPQWQIARSLRAMGVPEGARIGLVGNGLFAAYWARLGHFHIIAETTEVPRFWAATPERRNAVTAAMLRAGADVVVADGVPRSAFGAGWRRVGDSSYALWVPSR